nr:immunoglobulin heavy chain junction region [Mus musculus]
CARGRTYDNYFDFW